MKFIISLALFGFFQNAFSAPIQIFYEMEPARAKIVRSIFTQTYHIPEELIALVRTGDCEELKVKGMLDLCLKNNGDLLVVSVEKGFVSESLKIFYAP